MTVTEETLECLYCIWIGLEEYAVGDGNEEDPGFLCPACNEECSHYPLDEIGDIVETVISHGWTMKAP